MAQRKMLQCLRTQVPRAETNIKAKYDIKLQGKEEYAGLVMSST